MVQEELHIAARKEAGDRLKNDGQKVSLRNLHLAKLFRSNIPKLQSFIIRRIHFERHGEVICSCILPCADVPLGRWCQISIPKARVVPRWYVRAAGSDAMLRKLTTRMCS
jgi:hypothetical protein